MTEKDLKEYKSLCKEIKDLAKRIQRAEEKEVEVVAGKVKGSMKSFPYIETRIGIEINTSEQVQAEKDLFEMYQDRITRAEKKKLEIEQYIDNIENSQLRLIFQYRYIDGMKQREIARKLNLDRSRISRKVSNYLKNAHKAQKNVV